MKYLSPLRYPGGKARLAPFLADLICLQKKQPTRYAEPFAGGAGAALRLLYEGDVKHIHINDIHPGVAAFWRSVTQQSERFIALLKETPVTIEQWHEQREIFNQGLVDDDDVNLGFATFFLNRTNRSGILNARPIGGLEQQGKWKIDARYNVNGLVERIEVIAKLASHITVTQLDGLAFIDSLQGYGKDLLIYADPPYVVQGDKLYLRSFDEEAHKSLAEKLSKSLHPWVLTYDDEAIIWKELYKTHRSARFEIAHTAQYGHIGSEIIVYSTDLIVPEVSEITRGAKLSWLNGGPGGINIL